jgi:hypothetical protein
LRKKKMKADLIPLFALRDDVHGTVPITPTIMAGGTQYKPSSYIESVAKEIEPAISELAENKRLGYMTVAAYILLETLARAGLTSIVDSLLDNPEAIYQASLFVSIGMLAGEQMPAEVEIGTETSDSVASLRSIALRDGTDNTDSDG